VKSLLEKMRELNGIIQKAAGHPISFVEMAEKLSGNINANVYIIGRKGKILGYHFMEKYYCPTMDEIVNKDGYFPEFYNQSLLRHIETKINYTNETPCLFKEKNICIIEDKYTTIVPIIGGGQRTGTLMLAKSGKFEDSDLILAEYAATIIGMEILRAKVEKMEDIARQKAVVSIAFDTLSYSELEAIGYIFKELNDTNGLLVASKIADKVGITRSVIVNALRKLESAGVVEVRSLGMKGTYIRILNDYLLEELERIQSTYQRL